MRLPLGGAPPARCEQQGVDDEGKRSESCEMKSIGAPGLLLPDISLRSQAGPVAPPVASGPTRALVKELVAVLQSRLDFAFLVVLDPRLPLVTDQPSGNKVVVVGVQNPLPPFLVLESLEELVAGQDL